MKRRLELVMAALVALPALSLGALLPSAASAAGWSGWARCELNISGSGYQNKETHTWIVTDATTAAQGTGSWSAAGSGNLHTSDTVTTMRAEWAIAANALPGVRWGVTIPAVGQIRIRPFHSQLGQQKGITGYVQQTISGVARTPTAIGSTEYEWSFPLVQGAANSQTISGSGAGTPSPGWGTMRLSGTTMTVFCSWEFGNGYTPPAPPQVTPPPTPVPGGSQPPPAQPPPAQPADPCATRAREMPSASAARISSVVPRRFREGERIVICGRGLSMAALEDQYADSPTLQSLNAPQNAGFVLIGTRSLMALDPVIGARGDRIELTVGRLYERSELTQGIDVLIPVAPVPKEWSGPFAIRVQGESAPSMGPNVAWRPR